MIVAEVDSISGQIKNMAGPDQNPTPDGNGVECRLVLAFYSPSYQSLFSYVGIALQTSFGISDDELQIGKIHADKESDTTYIHFKIAGSDHISTWNIVSRLRNGISDPKSVLHTLPRMKNVFNNCRLEVREVSNEDTGPQKVLRYVEKAPMNPRVGTSFPLDRMAMSPPQIDSRMPPVRKAELVLPPHADKDPFEVILVDPGQAPSSDSPSGRFVKVELPASPKRPKSDNKVVMPAAYDMSAIDAALNKPRPVLPESLTRMMHELSIH